MWTLLQAQNHPRIFKSSETCFCRCSSSALRTCTTRKIAWQWQMMRWSKPPQELFLDFNRSIENQMKGRNGSRKLKPFLQHHMTSVANYSWDIKSKIRPSWLLYRSRRHLRRHSYQRQQSKRIRRQKQQRVLPKSTHSARSRGRRPSTKRWSSTSSEWCAISTWISSKLKWAQILSKFSVKKEKHHRGNSSSSELENPPKGTPQVRKRQLKRVKLKRHLENPLQKAGHLILKLLMWRVTMRRC